MRNYLVFVLSTITVSVSMLGCGPGQNYNQSAIYYLPVTRALIDKDLCANERDCIAKEFIFFEGGIFKTSPLYMNVYNIKKLEDGQSILHLAKTQRKLSTTGLKVTIYRTAHLESPQDILLQESIE